MMEEFHHPLRGFDADRPYHEMSDFGLLGEDLRQRLQRRHRRERQCAGLGRYPEKSQPRPDRPERRSDNVPPLPRCIQDGVKAHDIKTATAFANLYRQIARDPSVAQKMATSLAAAGKQVATH